MGGQRFSKQVMLILLAWGLAASGAIADGAARSAVSTPREIVWKFERSLDRLPMPERERRTREFFTSLKDPETRVEAIRMLHGRYVYVVPRSIYNEVLAPLLRDPDVKVRAEAAQAVGYNGLARDHAETLLELLKSDDPELKGNVFYALGSSRDRRFAATLQGYLSDPDPGLRITAANNLWRLDPQAKALLPLLRDAEPTVRAAIVQLLPRAPEARRLLTDTSPLVRRSAVRAMGDAGEPGLASLIAPLLKDPEAQVRAQAAYGIGRLKATRYGDRLETMLTQDKAEIPRRYAAMALAELRSAKHLAGLRAARKDVDEQVREYAARAIRLIEDPTLHPDTLR